MKRLRSSDDLDSYGEKGIVKDWGRREEDPGLHRSSSSHRSSYYKSSESGRKGLSSSSSSRYDRLEDEREGSRSFRKWSDYDMDAYDRRKGYDRHREGNERGILCSSPRVGYGMDRIHRSESFSGPRRDFPKGFRSESKRSRREGSVSSWRRFSGGKDGDDGNRSSGSELGRGNRAELDDVGKVKSPQGTRDPKSPAWSKDSVSDQSKSFEVKRSEDLQVDSVAPCTEREEGELEPDPQPVPSFKHADEKLNSSQKDLDHEHCVQDKVEQQKENSSPSEMADESKMGNHEEPAEVGKVEDVQETTHRVSELPDGKDISTLGISGSADENEATGDNSGGSDGEVAGRGRRGEEADTAFPVKLSTIQKEHVEQKGTYLEAKAANTDLSKTNTGFAEDIEVSLKEDTSQNLKDKGKSIAVLPLNGNRMLETDLEVEKKSRGLPTFEDSGFEGPSTRGFEFFSNDPVKKHEKVEQSHHSTHKDDKLALDLSLSLPNVLLPIGAQNRGLDPGSPSHARSAQSFPSSFRTNSDGFTASMSFSGSQQFTHNPSCSLTYDACDYEKSVGSRPLFQGVDWKALSSDDHKNKESSIYQGSSIGNNVHHQSQASQGNSSGQPVLQHLRVVDGSSKVAIGLDRQLSVNKHLRGAQSQQLNDIRSPSQSIGSHENRTGYSKDWRAAMKDRDNASLHRISNPDGKEQALVVGADFAESIVTMIVADPLQTMAQRFNEMTQQQVVSVKEFVREIILNPGKQWQLSALQKALRNRKDITQDALVNSHVSQLEILVALKTGLQDFLQQNYNTTTSELAEIFLNLRCRNLTCRSLVPVDECDCKICTQRKGFCRDCMCLVCSKFDMASNTCSWVGCDVCLHWCHADCGLQESYIRNGRSASVAQGTTEMQFHCVACDHPSEMFGFVKAVFQNYVKEWTAETLSKELEYVRRIFSASEDLRGRKLHEMASQILSKLSTRLVDLQEVQNHILGFLNDSDSFRPVFVPAESRKDLPTINKESSNGIAGSSQGAMWLKSVSSDKAPRLDRSVSLFSSFDGSRDDKYKMNMDLRAEKEPVFDELESIVRIKQAEAKMFQSRADDARREAEALKRIAVMKNEKIEEEYTSRIAKLRLTEADEMHKQKVEELQGFERAYQEYSNMKMRMETDIKDLLLKMEATRRNLTM